MSLDPAEGDIGEQLRARFDPRQFRLDLRRAPLLRGFIARDASRDRWLLLLLAHHLVLDHTTLEILVEEARAHLLGPAEGTSVADAVPQFRGAGAARDAPSPTMKPSSRQC